MTSIRPEVEALLRDRAAYPHPVDAIRVEETHISQVFLTGRWVYKLKKPVDLGFLDATTLEKRCRLCEREIALNRRLSQGVYEDVVPITRRGDRLALAGEGERVECAVRMRQLPADRTMERLLEAGALTDSMVEALAAKLAAFHAASDAGDEVARFGRLETVAGNARENFEQLDPFVGRFLRSGFWEEMRDSVERFMERRRALFEARVRNRRIRDGHGDLRLDHVYFTDDGIQVIDCIEFNDRFRNGDVAADLAFPVTELEFRDEAGRGRELARHYARAAEDPEVFALLDFYRNYRALVRAKVECLRLEAGGLGEPEAGAARRAAERYFELAHRYARILSRPTLWVVCGPIASGKSTLASELGSRLGLEVVRSDAVRKEIHGLEPAEGAEAAWGEGIYTDEATERTYAALLERAGGRLARGDSLVVDATFARRRHRQQLVDAAVRLGAAAIFLECRAPRSILRERLEARGEGGPSDARARHLDAMLGRYEPPEELDAARYLPLETDVPRLQTLVDAFSGAFTLRERQAVETVT